MSEQKLPWQAPLNLKNLKSEARISNWKQGIKHAMESEIIASCKQLL